MPLVNRTDLDEFGQRVWDGIARARGHVPTSYRSMLNSPSAARAVGQLGEYLRYGSGVDGRARELAVLVVNRDADCAFGWAHHEILARAMGVSDDVIDAIRDRRSVEGLRPIEALSVQLAEETMRDGQASLETVAELVSATGEACTVDLVLAVGYYSMLAQYFLTMGLQLDPDALIGLAGRDVAKARARERRTSSG